MKKSFIIIAAVLLCVAYGACKKAKGPSNAKSVQPNNNLDSLVFMSATINGNDWHADSTFGYKVKSSGNDSNVTNLMITAVRKDNGQSTSIVFFINNFGGVANYAINPPVVTATYYEGTTRHYATYGGINITSNSDYALIGNFYFAADSISINGEFNVVMP